MTTQEQPRSPPAAEDYNRWADYWRNDVGLNVIPWNKGEGRSNRVNWRDFQDKGVPQELHDQWKQNGMFKDGIARMPGICWHKKPFNPRLRWWDIDIDKQSSIDAICIRNGKQATIEDLSKIFIVEMHEDDPVRIHVGGYYESDESLPRLNPGDICELKCDGKHGITRCTNSLHYYKDGNGNIVENGNRYRIIGTLEPTINNEFIEQNILPKSKRYNGNGHAGGPGDVSNGGLNLDDKDIRRITEPLQPLYKEGYRNGIVLGISGVLCTGGICETSVNGVIEELAKNDSRDDLRHALKTVEDTFKNNRKVAGTRYLQEALFSATIDEKAGTYNRNLANEILGKIFAVIREVKDRGQSKQEKEDIIQWLRRNVMAEYTIHTTNDNKELYLYDEKSGVYQANQEWRIEAFCQSICHDAKSGELYEVIQQVKRRTYINRSKFDSDTSILNLKNGLLNIHTLDFTEHSRDHLSTVQLPLWYNPEAKCPNILRFLGQVLKPKDVFTALQFFGYCLYRTAKYEHATLCVGSGANGKGTFLRLLGNLLGKKNVSHVSLQEIGEDKFATAELYGKLANICADLGKTKVKDTGKFKMLVSGDRMSAQHKNKDRFEFDPYAKLIFSANEIPESDDRTYAYFRRWIMFSFENVFEGDADENMIDKLTTQNELSGLLNLTLRALKQLIKDNGFAYIDDIKTVTKTYTMNANSVSRFLEEKCEVTGRDENYILCTDLRNAYFNFCKEKNLHCKSDEMFGRELPDSVTRRRPRVKGNPEWHYFGIRLKPEPSSP
jgi:P4 family phage/plasmid primase-like protien